MSRMPIGRKQAEIAMRWIGSLSTFGAAGGLTVVYMTDWKLILQYVPFINGAFKKEEE